LGGQVDYPRRRGWSRLPLVLAALWMLWLPGFPGWLTSAQAVETEPVQPIGNLIQIWDPTGPEGVNAYLAKWDSHIVPGVTDPFDVHVQVTEIQPTQTMYFVRFYTGNDPRGSWIMRAEFVRGLTPEQLRDRFALPELPTGIVMVKVPPGAQYGLWTGIAGPIWSPGYYWGQGGGQQTKIIGWHDSSDPPPDPARFASYDRLPGDSYTNAQPIGAKALAYTGQVRNGNAGRVAAYLDRFIPAPYSDLEYVYTALDFLNWANNGPAPLAAALRQIGPERYGALSNLGLRNSLLFGDALLERSQALRLGLASAAATPQALGAGLGQLAKLAAVSAFASPGLASPGLGPAEAARGGPGFWVRGVGEFGDQAGGGQCTGFAYHTGGVVGGIDYQPGPEVILGFGAAYLGSGLNWNNNGGSAGSNNVKFGLYASYFTPRFFLDGVFTGGVNWTAVQRSLDFTGEGVSWISGLPVDSLPVNRQAASDQTGHDLALHLQSGVNLSLGGWDLTPLARVSYFYINEDGGAEHGAGSLNLNLQGMSAQTVRTQLGLRLGRTLVTASGLKLTPEVKVGWAHEFPLDNRVINAGLSELGGIFAVNGFTGQTDSLVAGAGLTARLSNGLAIAGGYGAELQHGFTAQMVNLGLRFAF
jgi:uncharacterized protein YhjY with autotransporter beta-barrel domain